MVFMFLDDLKTFMNAVKKVTTENGFDLATEKAQKARLTAVRLLEFFNDNKDATSDFASKLVENIKKCCSHPKAVTCHKFKERMWEKFFKLCSTDDFKHMWKKFIQTSIGFDGSPIFYQYVTREILDDTIRKQLPIAYMQQDASFQKPLDFEEANALLYCGGYIIRSLKKKMEKSACPLKEDIMLCLDDLIEGTTEIFLLN